MCTVDSHRNIAPNLTLQLAAGSRFSPPAAERGALGGGARQMPRQETILQVFVAAPSDLAEERAALEDVIWELNSTWSRTLGCRLDLLRWETHAVPGMGLDAQDVVNRSVPRDYDIFIGMLWSRFGTPTTRAESGTEEEARWGIRIHKPCPGLK